MKNTLIIAVAVGLIVGGGAFYGGMVYAKNQRGGVMRMQGAEGGNFRTFRAGQGGEGATGGAMVMRGGPGGAGGFTNGEVVAKDATSLTIKLRDGGSKNVFYSTSTTVSKTAQGSMDDVAQGTQVMIIGSANQDGSITASMVQLRPEGFGDVASSTRRPQ